jgi:NADH:ubiquinone oxidoreductase subunit E
MTFRDAQSALEALMNAAPEFGQISLTVIYHSGQIARLERSVVEKIATVDAEATRNRAPGGSRAER